MAVEPESGWIGVVIDPSGATVAQFLVGGLVRRLVDSPTMTLAVTGLAVAFYLRRGMGVAATGGAILGTVVTYTVVLLVLVSIATMFGWIEPVPATAREHVITVYALARDTVFEWAVDAARGVIP